MFALPMATILAAPQPGRVSEGSNVTAGTGASAGRGGSAEEELLTRGFGSSRVRVEGVLAIYN